MSLLKWKLFESIASSTIYSELVRLPTLRVEPRVCREESAVVEDVGVHVDDLVHVSHPVGSLLGNTTAVRLLAR